jgi:hypothetical protein
MDGIRLPTSERFPIVARRPDKIVGITGGSS